MYTRFVQAQNSGGRCQAIRSDLEGGVCGRVLNFTTVSSRLGVELIDGHPTVTYNPRTEEVGHNIVMNLDN